MELARHQNFSLGKELNYFSSQKKKKKKESNYFYQHSEDLSLYILEILEILCCLKLTSSADCNYGMRST